jgi:ribulose-phosphate 3-epimerase
MLIAPSILSADFAQLDRDIAMLNRSKADWLHVDVMDGQFVPNISLGFPIIEAIKRHAQKPLDVHLMIINPDRYLSEFVQAGANILTVHYEACTHLHRTLSAIRALGAQAGVALNPHTPVSLLADIISQIDLVCLMSVNPGFGGQRFIEHTYTKTRQLRQLIAETGATTRIEIDGGVTLQNAPLLCQAGADVLVAGNTVFKANNPEQCIADLKTIQ